MARAPLNPPTSTEELVKRFSAGERDFSGTSIRRAALAGSKLPRIQLPGAMLRGADLSGADVSDADLRHARLSEAKLSQANLEGACLVRADLSRANLENANLTSVDLTGANLAGACLKGACLSGANLTGASAIGADLRTATLSGVMAFRAKLDNANLHKADLSGADFTRASFANSDLASVTATDANFSESDLVAASFAGAELVRATLSGANLDEASFVEASLIGAKLASSSAKRSSFYDAKLAQADMSSADLSEADLTGAILLRATFGGTRMYRTKLLDVDLTALCEASPPVIHDGASYVNERSVLTSVHAPNLKTFLQQAGMPEIFVEYMVECAKAMTTDVFHLTRSTFISYGEPDEHFARKLYEALHRNGIRTFFFPEHAVPGQKLRETMRQGVSAFDRVIVVCSRASLRRSGILYEIEETLTREANSGGEALLIPVRLDNYVFTEWNPPSPDVAAALRDRVVADFEGADTDPAKFDAGLRRLIAALRK